MSPRKAAPQLATVPAVQVIAVTGGKGGTGKTSIAGSFAALAKNKVLVDCDVDAADLHLILQPTAQREQEFWSGQVAFIDKEKCIQCDVCRGLCRFEAIKDYQIDPVSCEGCGFCTHVCPVVAITMKDCMAGHWFISNTRYGYLVHARLGTAQEMNDERSGEQGCQPEGQGIQQAEHGSDPRQDGAQRGV